MKLVSEDMQSLDDWLEAQGLRPGDEIPGWGTVIYTQPSLTLDGFTDVHVRTGKIQVYRGSAKPIRNNTKIGQRPAVKQPSVEWSEPKGSGWNGHDNSGDFTNGWGG